MFAPRLEPVSLKVTCSTTTFSPSWFEDVPKRFEKLAAQLEKLLFATANMIAEAVTTTKIMRSEPIISLTPSFAFRLTLREILCLRCDKISYSQAKKILFAKYIAAKRAAQHPVFGELQFYGFHVRI
jgi:hypothetical protein